MSTFLMWAFFIPLIAYAMAFWARLLKAGIKGHKQIAHKVNRLHAAAKDALRDTK